MILSVDLNLFGFADSLQLDKDASADINSTIAPTYGSLKELRSHHDNNVVEIKQNTGKCLGHEYKVMVKFWKGLFKLHLYIYFGSHSYLIMLGIYMTEFGRII